MAPPGPPPYTLDQLNTMTSPEEQMRARAELKSYIARLKKEKEERLANETTYGNSITGPSEAQKAYGRGFVRGGNIYRGSGRGYGSFHPYQRPQAPHVVQTFKNKSVTFNKSDASAESSDTGEVTSPHRCPNNHAQRQSYSQQQTRPKTLCPALTSTGVCTRHGCRCLHDPNQQALCKRWLFKDDCPKGSYCPLSHRATPHNAPTCLHFQEGRCNHDSCRFAHIRINPAALNCEGFGRLGYCEKGATCGDLHAFECPNFSNTGTCRYGDKCRLGHVHRASRMRKASRPSSAERSSRSGSVENDEDLAEKKQGECTRLSRDPTSRPHQFTQQADFVPFDVGG